MLQAHPQRRKSHLILRAQGRHGILKLALWYKRWMKESDLDNSWGWEGEQTGAVPAS